MSSGVTNDRSSIAAAARAAEHATLPRGACAVADGGVLPRTRRQLHRVAGDQRVDVQPPHQA
jgi:hypothetical protein